MKRFISAALAAALLILAAACGGPIPPGTVTGKGVQRNAKGNAVCHWIKVRHDDGTKSRGCLSVKRWKQLHKGDHWSGS